MWKVNPAGQTRRTRRTTKVHEGGTADCTDLLQIKGVLAHADCQCGLDHRGAQRLAQRNTEMHCQFILNHKGHEGHKARRRGGPCVRVKRTSGPGACRAWRASHATLWGRALTRTRPGAGDAGDSGDAGAPLRGVKETVVQSGDSRRPSSPIGPTASCYGTSQTCRGAGRISPCRGVGQRPTPFQSANQPIS